MQATNNAAVQPKGYKGLGMEGFIATWYARQTAKDLTEFRETAQRLGAHIKPGACVLEIAPGPGYLAIEVAKLTGCRMVGIDISRSFVRIADDNARRAGLDIAFDEGDAAAMPYPANAFDFVFCRAAFKNFRRPLTALDEIYRVLKPGRDAVIIDLRKDFSPQAVSDYVRGKGVLNGAVIKFTFNTMLKKRAYTPEGIARLASQSRFGRGDVRLDSIGFELWLHKSPD
jgi:ubiquinone/menaquinone biosynthesis C-methylase UbiE